MKPVETLCFVLLAQYVTVKMNSGRVGAFHIEGSNCSVALAAKNRFDWDSRLYVISAITVSFDESKRVKCSR